MGGGVLSRAGGERKKRDAREADEAQDAPRDDDRAHSGPPSHLWGGKKRGQDRTRLRAGEKETAKVLAEGHRAEGHGKGRLRENQPARPVAAGFTGACSTTHSIYAPPLLPPPINAMLGG